MIQLTLAYLHMVPSSSTRSTRPHLLLICNGTTLAHSASMTSPARLLCRLLLLLRGHCLHLPPKTWLCHIWKPLMCLAFTTVLNDQSSSATHSMMLRLDWFTKDALPELGYPHLSRWIESTNTGVWNTMPCSSSAIWLAISATRARMVWLILQQTTCLHRS